MDLGIERSIFVVPSPVDTKACRDGRREGLRLRRTLGITQSILSVGRLSAEKNVDLLIRMFARLHERNDSVRLVIIGDGPERKNLFSLASKLGVNTWITWCGNIPHHKLLMGGYYYLGDIFVTLSTMETQGLSTSEAMACGLPIIGARAVGTKEIVGENGILVSPSQSVKIAEAINTLFNNKSDLKRFKEMSLSAVTQFSVDTCVAKLEAINKHLADVT